METRRFTIAQIQQKVRADKMENVGQLERALDSVSGKAQVAMAGEMFCCPYETKNFPVYAEEEGGPVWQRLSRAARDNGLYLVAGSMPERDGAGRIYNTSYVFDPQGRQIAKHRKIYLFDIDVEGGQSFRESDTLTAGDQVTVFSTEFCTMGLCICFDFRFPELGKLMAKMGAEVILVPAAFNMTTGPAHWELMHRQRAVEDQCFVAATSPARDMAASYHAYGNSMLVSPWGETIYRLGGEEGIMINEVDLGQVDKVRREIPLLSSARDDVICLEKRRKEK